MKKRRYIVDEDGVLETELEEGDRIVRSKTTEFLSNKMLINYEEYATVNMSEFRLLAPDLDKKEKAAIMTLLSYVQYSTCLICFSNGNSIGTEDMPKLLGLSRNTAYNLLTSLVKKDILYRGRNSKEVQYFMNPWLIRKGKSVNKVLKTMFRNYYIRSLKTKVKNL